MNTNGWAYPKSRASCAAGALLVSTVLLCSVVWLFSSADTTADRSVNVTRSGASQQLASLHTGRVAQSRDPESAGTIVTVRN